MTLAEFLLAWIAEREELARQMQDEVRIFTEDPGFTLEWRYAYSTRHTSGGRGSGRLWTVYPDTPEDILAECEAKRRIVEEHGAKGELHRHCQTCGGTDYPVDWPCDTLRLLALPYANHPDYDPAWQL